MSASFIAKLLFLFIPFSSHCSNQYLYHCSSSFSS